MTQRDYLINARARVAKGWMKGMYQDPLTGHVCAAGALRAELAKHNYGRTKANLFDTDYLSAYRRLQAQIPRTYNGYSLAPDVPAYNDAPTTTKADILTLFDRAIASLEPVPVAERAHAHALTA